MLDGEKATTREMFFYLHTDNGLYRCDIREVLESRAPADVGVSSVSVFLLSTPEKTRNMRMRFIKDTVLGGGIMQVFP